MDIGYSGYIDSEICRQFSLLILPLFICKFVHRVEMKGYGIRGLMWSIASLACYEYHFIRVHGYLVQHQSDNISIKVSIPF